VGPQGPSGATEGDLDITVTSDAIKGIAEDVKDDLLPIIKQVRGYVDNDMYVDEWNLGILPSLIVKPNYDKLINAAQTAMKGLEDVLDGAGTSGRIDGWIAVLNRIAATWEEAEKASTVKYIEG
jgi:hypothetical protein